MRAYLNNGFLLKINETRKQVSFLKWALHKAFRFFKTAATKWQTGSDFILKHNEKKATCTRCLFVDP